VSITTAILTKEAAPRHVSAVIDPTQVRLPKDTDLTNPPFGLSDQQCRILRTGDRISARSDDSYITQIYPFGIVRVWDADVETAMALKYQNISTYRVIKRDDENAPFAQKTRNFLELSQIAVSPTSVVYSCINRHSEGRIVSLLHQVQNPYRVLLEYCCNPEDLPELILRMQNLTAAANRIQITLTDSPLRGWTSGQFQP
jgi:hypothetical protein